MENIRRIINTRIKLLTESKKTFKDIFNVIHSKEDAIFCEITDGSKIYQTTYGECKEKSIKMGNFFSKELQYVPHGEYVGLMMENSLNWITCFWGLLMAGYKPMLLNIRLGTPLVNEIIDLLNVKATISDKLYDISCKQIVVDNNITLDDLKIIPDFNWENHLALSTSATSLNVKICVYNGSEIAEQIFNSKQIIKSNYMIKQHYKGTLKLLAFLPFYHVFGLMANYFWFAFFGRTFVFLKNYSNDTIVRTARKHQVTHVFGVPMLWQQIYLQIIKQVEASSDKVKKKFYKGIKISNQLQSIFPRLGKIIATKMFKNVQNKIFGTSIKFLISGGSYIPNKVLEVMNGIGYPLYVGYGMSEIGITSVELRKNAKKRNLGSIGKPFLSVEYKINEENCLMIKGNSLCSEIIIKNNTFVVNHDEWFNTHDLVTKDKKGYYTIHGRQDDIVLTPNGEKINPDAIEKELEFENIKRYCVIGINENNINYLALIVECGKLDKYTSKLITDDIERNIINLSKLNYQIDKIYVTTDAIATETSIKVSRTILNKWLQMGSVKLIPYSQISDRDNYSYDNIFNEISENVKNVFAATLNKEPNNIGLNDHFIFDLEGTSLEYLSLLIKLKEMYGIDFIFSKDEYCYSIKQFSNYIINNK